MMTISFGGLGTSIIGKNLWQIAALTVLWIVWQVRNVGIFEEKWRMERMSWNILNVYSSLWASCTVAFRGVSLNVIQLSWLLICNSKGVDNIERS